LSLCYKYANKLKIYNWY